MHDFLICAAIALVLTGPATADNAEQSGVKPDEFGPAFFEDCAFVCVDLQEIPRTRMKPENISSDWKKQGFTADDCNAATDYLFDTAMPNAVVVADACRARKLPMIFVHWGYLCEDGMDLDPMTRRQFLKDIGPDPKKWPHHISDPTSRPAEALKVREGEYVVAKSGQDAFNSSRIEFILRNLGMKNIIFIGGHTQGCLFRTASSAKRLGFNTLCVEDATWNARESTRKAGIEASNFTYGMTTKELVSLLGCEHETAPPDE